MHTQQNVVLSPMKLLDASVFLTQFPQLDKGYDGNKPSHENASEKEEDSEEQKKTYHMKTHSTQL